MYHIARRSHSHTVELENIHLQAKAPSIFALQPIVGVSEQYTFLPTMKIVDAMRDDGWMAVDVQEQRVRLETRRGFQKHMIKFQRRDVFARVGEYAGEISIVNSHDRSCAFQVGACLYRFVCSNGLMVADSSIQSVSIRHSGHENAEVIVSGRSKPASKGRNRRVQNQPL